MTLRREVGKALLADGFAGHGGTYSRREGSGFVSLVDVGPLNKRPDIAPRVGIRFEPLEDLLTELRGLPRSPNAETYGSNVGYVLYDDFTIWSPPSTCAEVHAAIHDALHVLRRYMTLEQIPQGLMEIRAAMANPSAGYRMVLVPFMLKRPGKVVEALEQAQLEYCRKPGQVCDQFRQFQDRIMDRMNRWSTEA